MGSPISANNSEWMAQYPCVRALLMLFNIAFWTAGFTLVWMGIWMRTDFEMYLKINENYSEWAPYVLMIIGTVILFVASLACSCIIKVQPSLLVIYGGFLVTMIYTLISLTIYIYSYKEKLVNGIEPGLKYEITNYELYTSGGYNVTLLDKLQRDLHCCGIKSHSDWQRENLPKSCCLPNNDGVDCNQSSKLVFNQSCYPILNNMINSNLNSMGVTTSAFVLFSLFGTIFSFTLAVLGGNKGGYERIG